MEISAGYAHRIDPREQVVNLVVQSPMSKVRLAMNALGIRLWTLDFGHWTRRQKRKNSPVFNIFLYFNCCQSHNIAPLTGSVAGEAVLATQVLK